MKILILGTGCARCKTLTANAKQAVRDLGLKAEVEKVTEIRDIMKFQILMTPGLAIDGKVKAAGRIAQEKVLETVKIVRLALATKVIGDGEPIFEALENAN
jgi:small redox-active disulfide protein 2